MKLWTTENRKTNAFLEIIRASDAFDAKWYLTSYPDVAEAGMDPALHYYMYGAKERRDPSGTFSTSGYLKHHPLLLVSDENPILHREKTRKLGKRAVHPGEIRSDRMVEKIPRLFHTVWLSRDEVPPPLALGERSFSAQNPSFEIKRWTIDDLDGDETRFFRQSLSEKKWAFATDYIRLKALYEHGGIYADGDVAFYRSVEKYLGYDAVLTWENFFAVGPHFLMSAPRNPLIGRLLDIYKNRDLYRGDDLDLTPMPVIVTWALVTEYNLRLDGSRQVIGENNLVESENVFTTNFNDNECVAEHMYYGGWVADHSVSYKDGLVDIAARWARENEAIIRQRDQQRNGLEDDWAFYFLKNAETAFPVISELPNMERFEELKKSIMAGETVSKRHVQDAVAAANPLASVSKWHLKSKTKLVKVADTVERRPDTNFNFSRIISKGALKVSIVVPIYNVEKYLPKCLLSIQSQDHKHIEVLLVDDGSTDNSGAVAEAMAKSDVRFKYLKKKNGGLGDARNFAIPHLDSDLVTFVDSDDYLDVCHVSKLEAQFRYGHDLAICDFKLTTPDGRLIETRELGKFWNESDSVKHALVSNYECYAWNKMYATESFTKNDLARYSVGWFEDFSLTPALIAASKNIGFVSEPTYNYVQRPDSILSTARKNIGRNLEVFSAFEHLCRHRSAFPDQYWDIYYNWMAPKHYFYWRIMALLGERSHGARVAFCGEFARSLNEKIVGWEETDFIKHFITDSPTPHISGRRRELVDALIANDLAFYGLASDVSEFAL